MSKDKNFYDRLAILSESDTSDPLDVIEQYCERQPLFDARIEICEMFAAALGSMDWGGDTPIEKANRLYHLKLLLRITETVYLLEHLRSTGRLQYSIRPEK